ncbi:MAG: hypothetical protein QHJ73_05125, partial [Armatimonadota bacterium]|nr:hypothetical protein [Armatimonadota bacterium]
MHPSFSFIGVCLLGGVASLAPAAAEPCTLYKARHIATARQNIARHGWAKALLAAQQNRAAAVMALDRAALEAMVPDLTPWSVYGQVCPACVGKRCAMGETGVLRWGGLANPDRLTCQYCGMGYPNPEFPETGVLECPRMGQRFTYYLNDQQRAHPNEDPGKYAYRWAGRPVHVSFSGLIRAYKVQWALSQVRPLAQLYVLTGESGYAERAAWILYRLAQVFPKYLYHSYGGCFADIDPAEAAREMGRHPAAGKFAPGVIRHPAAEMRDRN